MLYDSSLWIFGQRTKLVINRRKREVFPFFSVFCFYPLHSYNELHFLLEPTHTYKKFSVKTANRSYNVLLQGTDSQMQENGMYECFSITTSDGKTLLTQWGKNPLCKVGNLTQVKNTDEFFIQVPLDDESIALIFAGWLFETSNEAGEMIVVVVNRDEATVVFDKPAFGTSYMPHPKFSLSFVSDVFWPDDESADPKAITIPPFLKP